MIDVAAERQHPQLGEAARLPHQQLAALQDLLQEQRIGAIEEGEIHLPFRKERLQIGLERDEALERRFAVAQQHREIHDARRMRNAACRRAEAQQQLDAMVAGELSSRAGACMGVDDTVAEDERGRNPLVTGSVTRAC